ncbi:MAG: hypothetical protein M3072_07730 [Candidatus Dormibacteraeota bacterium]|nr:hypothetical protein [Candidatus Dormibacteraeota bacterium]
MIEATAALFRGDPAAAETLMAESLRWYEAAGPPMGVCVALHSLASLKQLRGDLEGSAQLLERALKLALEQGDRANEGLILVDLGFNSGPPILKVDSVGDQERRWEDSVSTPGRLEEAGRVQAGPRAP